MNLNNFLYSGFKFRGDEDLLQFKFKMLNSIFPIVAFFAVLFGVMSDLGVHDLGTIHSKVNYVYGFLTVILIFFLRQSKQNYEKASQFLLLISFATFTSALILVPQNEFRIIWFYLLILGAYMLKGSTSGVFYTVAAVGIILAANLYVDLQLSQKAINASILGLMIGSFLSLVYTNKITDYENSLKQQNSSLSLLASTDYLTGIMNRRIFNEISKHYFQTAQRDNLNLTLLLLDLDHFKNINDTYGHQSGDQVLIHFVKSIEKTIRESDIFARIGGEEFAILLSQTDNDTAYDFAEKIRTEIENMTVQYEGKEISVTTSIGISINSKVDNSFDDMFTRADQAMYQAKKAGRNQTCYIRL